MIWKASRILAIALLAAEVSACALDAQPDRAPAIVYECPDGLDIVVRTGPGEIDLFLPDRYAVLRQAQAASGTKYQAGDLGFWSKGDEATLEMGNSRVAGCRRNHARAPWEGARLRGAAFRATGNEPGWHLEIYPGSQITFVTDLGETELQTTAPEPELDHSTGVRVYHADAEAHDLRITIEAEACRDSMSGARFSSTVHVALDGREYRGCGRELGPVFAGRWRLERFGGGDTARAPVEGSEPSLLLDAWGLVSGSGGCNRFSGGYEFAERPSLSFRPLASTMMACSEPLGSQESRFLDALANTNGYRISGSELSLVDREAAVLLVFSSAGQTP